MKSILLAFSLCFSFFTSLVHAQENSPKWRGEFNVFRGYVWGNDVHVGDIVGLSSEFPTADYLSVKYGRYNSPIYTKPSGSYGWSYEAGRRFGKNWRLGLGGLSFKSNASVNEMAGIFFTCACVAKHGIRLWDHILFLLPNEDMPGAAIPYWAKNDLSLWTVDVFAARTLKESNRSYWALDFGGRIGNIKNTRVEGESQTAFLFDYFGEGVHFVDNVKIESTTSLTLGFFGGPTLGFSGELGYRGFKLKISGKESLLFGYANHDGLFTDVDEIHAVSGAPHSAYHDLGTVAKYDGLVKLDVGEKFIFTMTDLKLGFNQSIHRHIDFGVGTFMYLLPNIQLASHLSFPGDWTFENGTGWVWNEKRSVVITGFSASVAVKF